MWAACDINVVPSCELPRRWWLLTTTAHHWGGLTRSSVRSSLPHWWGFWFAPSGWSLVSITFSRSKLGWPLGHGVVTGPTADWGNSHNSGWKLSPSLCSQEFFSAWLLKERELFQATRGQSHCKHVLLSSVHSLRAYKHPSHSCFEG